MRYSPYTYTVTLKPGLRAIQGHRKLYHSIGNHRPISHRFRDKRRFQSKIAKFSNPRVFIALAEWVLLGIGYRRKGPKTRMMRLPEGRRSFKIGLAVLTQYRRVTTSQPSFHSKYRAIKRRAGKMLHVSPIIPLKIIGRYISAMVCAVIFHRKHCSKLFEVTYGSRPSSPRVSLG